MQHVRDEKTTGTAVASDAVYVEQVNALLTAASGAIYEEIKMMRRSTTMDTSSSAPRAPPPTVPRVMYPLLP